MAGRDRALNYAVRVKGQQEAAAAFRTVSQAATASIQAVAAAGQAAAAHDEAVARAAQSAAAFGAAQADANQQMAAAKAGFAAGTISAEAYQRTITDAKSGLALFKAENQSAARGVDLTARALVAAQQAASNYARELKQAQATAATPVASSAPVVDTRSGMQRLVAGDASVDRAAVSAATLEQVLGRVATKGQAVAVAMESAAQAENEQAAAADRLRARYNPLYAVISNYLTAVREIRQAERDGVLSADERTAAINRERQATLGAVAALKQQTAADHANAGARRAGFISAGQQINDITTQLSTNTPIAQVFAQQSGQVVGALSMMAKEGSTAAAVMGGPWGLAIVTGVSILGLLATKLFDTGHGLDEMVAKLKQDADEQKKTDAAHVAFSKTLEGQIVLQQKLNEEMERGLRSQREQNQQALVGAQQKIDDAQRTLSTLSRDLVAAQAALKEVYNTAPDTMNSSSSAAYSQRLAEAKAKVADVERRIKTAYEDIATAQQGVRDAKAVIAVDDAQAVVDPLKAIANKYQDLRDAAIEAAKGNDKLTASLKDTLAAINLKEKTEREAAEKKDKKTTETTAFSMPVDGRVSGQFGEQRPGHLHQGIDIAVPVGTPVRADAGGVIIEAGTLPGYGNVVFIDHGGGTITRLAHLSKIDVAKGQVVGKGDIIGASGGAKGAPGAGDSTGPHLHYEVRVGGRSVDPRKGPFPTDSLGAANKAEGEQQRLAEEAIRHQKEFADQSAQIDRSLLAAKRANLVEAIDIAASERDQVAVEQQKYEADINAKVALGDYTDAQGKVLIEKSKQLTAEQLLTINMDLAARQASELFDDEAAAIENRVDLLSAQQALAKTSSQRLDLALKMLEQEEEQARLAAKKTIADYMLGQATLKEAIRAQERLDNLDRLHPLKVEQINRQNSAALGKYLQDTDPKTINDRVETLVTNELTQVRDGINDALTNALGVKDPLLKGLLEIFLDQVLFRPIAEALQKRPGGGGGGFGSILGSIASLFGSSISGGGGDGGFGAGFGHEASHALPGFASGTDDLPLGLSQVGENGREILFNSGGGRVSVLNNQRSRDTRQPVWGGGGGHTTVININSPQPGNPRRIGAVVGRSAQLGAGRAARKGLAAPRMQR